ncbi:MAG: RNA methyltransferase [Gemmatimonadota bacterium]|nr:RNA methyltransferase [Gemmatimonadota bacterium]
MSLSQRRERLIARLRVPKTRGREGAVLVEGVRAVSEALDAGVAPTFAVVSPRLEESAAGSALAGRLGGLELVRLEQAQLDLLSDTETGQGVMLVCGEPSTRLDSIASGGRYLVLDGVQDPGNTGTLIRAAVAFGLDAVLCLDGTADPWGPKPVRASAGMIFRVPVVRAPAPAAVKWLEASGVPLYVADAKGRDVQEQPRMESFAIAVGNEGRGVRALLAESAQGMLAVRMRGGAESLNVAMAGSIIMHALTREP